MYRAAANKGAAHTAASCRQESAAHCEHESFLGPCIDSPGLAFGQPLPVSPLLLASVHQESRHLRLRGPAAPARASPRARPAAHDNLKPPLRHEHRASGCSAPLPRSLPSRRGVNVNVQTQEAIERPPVDEPLDHSTKAMTRDQSTSSLHGNPGSRLHGN